MLVILVAAALADSTPPCTFVPGAGIGDSDVLLSGNFDGVEQQCGWAVRNEHPAANGARLHSGMCSAVYAMRAVNNDPLGEQRTCYLFPLSSMKDVCNAAPQSCKGTHSDATLSLTDAALVGFVPSQLGMLHATLEHLDLSRNAISGTLPSELGRLTQLRILALQLQGLSGSIPSEVGRLTALHHLSLYGNGLSGSLPSELGRVNPPYCYLVARQLPRAMVDGSTVSDEDRASNRASSAGEPPQLGADNRFDCPLPALSAGCGMNGLAFSGRDAHHLGQCDAIPGVSYHALPRVPDTSAI